MKFKNLMIAALAAVALIGCNKDDNAPDLGLTGQQTYMKVSLSVANANAKAFRGNPAVTPLESQVNTLKLYVFGSAGFEQVVDVDAIALSEHTYSKVFETTTGSKTFLVAANLAAYPDFNAGDAIAVAHGELLPSTLGGLTDITPAATDKAFWMTSTGDVTQIIVAMTQSEADGLVGTGDNYIEINMGRAVAKVGVYFDETKGTATNNTGKLTDVTYKIGNNPDIMYAFTSNDGNGYRMTPYYNGDGTYFNNAEYLPTTLDVNTNQYANPDYMMENSNLLPTEGNATLAYLKGTFEPSVAFDTNGNPATYTPRGNFYRAYHDNVINNRLVRTYGDRFYIEPPSITEIEEQLGITGVIETSGYIATYEGGTAFYGLHLKNESVTTGSINQYTVKRNQYWGIEITSVGDCGAPTEEDVIIDPDTPLTDVAWVNAVITVVDWDTVSMDGDI